MSIYSLKAELHGNLTYKNVNEKSLNDFEFSCDRYERKPVLVYSLEEDMDYKALVLTNYESRRAFVLPIVSIGKDISDIRMTFENQPIDILKCLMHRYGPSLVVSYLVVDLFFEVDDEVGLKETDKAEGPSIRFFSKRDESFCKVFSGATLVRAEFKENSMKWNNLSENELKSIQASIGSSIEKIIVNFYDEKSANVLLSKGFKTKDASTDVFVSSMAAALGTNEIYYYVVEAIGKDPESGKANVILKRIPEQYKYGESL